MECWGFTEPHGRTQYTSFVPGCCLLTRQEGTVWIGHALIFTPLGDRRRPLVVCFSTYVRNFLPSQTPCILNDPGVFRKFICLLHPQMTMVPLRPVSVFVV